MPIKLAPAILGEATTSRTDLLPSVFRRRMVNLFTLDILLPVNREGQIRSKHNSEKIARKKKSISLFMSHVILFVLYLLFFTYFMFQEDFCK